MTYSRVASSGDATSRRSGGKNWPCQRGQRSREPSPEREEAGLVFATSTSTRPFHAESAGSVATRPPRRRPASHTVLACRRGTHRVKGAAGLNKPTGFDFMSESAALPQCFHAKPPAPHYPSGPRLRRPARGRSQQRHQLGSHAPTPVVASGYRSRALRWGRAAVKPDLVGH